jgi:hypothetical protein
MAPPSRPNSNAGQPVFPQPGDLIGDRGPAPRAIPDSPPAYSADRIVLDDLSSIGNLADRRAAEETDKNMLDSIILGYDPFTADVWGNGEVVDWLRDTPMPLPQGAPPSPGLPAGLEIIAVPGDRVGHGNLSNNVQENASAAVQPETTENESGNER